MEVGPSIVLRPNLARYDKTNDSCTVGGQAVVGPELESALELLVSHEPSNVLWGGAMGLRMARS